MAKVNIFYQELNYRTVEETPVYSVSQPGTKSCGGGRTSPGQTPWGPAMARPCAPAHGPLMPAGARAALRHGQPLEPVVRLICPLCPGAVGAAARCRSPHTATGLPPAPQNSGVPDRGSHSGVPRQAGGQPVAHRPQERR